MDKRGVALTAGIALIAVSNLKSGKLFRLMNLASDRNAPAAAAGEFATLGGEFILLGGIWLFAGISDAAAAAMLAFIGAMWLAWILNNQAGVVSFIQKIGVPKQ